MYDKKLYKLMNMLYPTKIDKIHNFYKIQKLLDNKTLYKLFVETVHFETTTSCNRRCIYCPNKYEPRKHQIITDNILYKYISELEEIEYENKISFIGFSEPLYDLDIYYKVLNLVNKSFPKSITFLVTNGDYITREILDSLENKVQVINWTVHQPDDIVVNYELQKVEKSIQHIIEKLKLNDYIIDIRKVDGRNVTYFLIYKKILIYFFGQNIYDYGNDRAGYFKKKNVPVASKNHQFRIPPCHSIMTHMSLFANGSVTGCETWYPGENENQYGNILDDTIFNLYWDNPNMKKLRDQAMIIGEKKEPCKGCNTNLPYTDKYNYERLLLRNLLKEYYPNKNHVEY